MLGCSTLGSHFRSYLAQGDRSLSLDFFEGNVSKCFPDSIDRGEVGGALRLVVGEHFEVAGGDEGGDGDTVFLDKDAAFAPINVVDEAVELLLDAGKFSSFR